MGSVDDFYHAMIPYENRHRKNKKISQEEMEAYEKVIFLNIKDIELKNMSANKIHANLFNVILEYRNLFKIMIDFREKNKISDEITKLKNKSVGEILNHNFSQESVMNKKINGKTYKEILVMFLTQIYTRWSTLQNTLLICCHPIFEKLEKIKPNGQNNDPINSYICNNVDPRVEDLKKNEVKDMNQYCKDVIDFVSSKIDELKKSDDKATILSNLKTINIPKLKDSLGVKSLKDFDLDKILKLPED